MSGPRVNFLIAGTQKGGTTALASFLAQHPEICVAPVKEAHFFDSKAYAQLPDDAAIADAYGASFPNHTDQLHIGEATPIYMYLPRVAERIWRYNPAMKLICVLRDPVERAISHHRMERGRGNEWLPLPLALLAERWRLRNRQKEITPGKGTRRHSYLDRGFYSGQIENLLCYFPAEQIHLLTTEDLWERHAQTLTAIYRFLGVKDCSFIPPQERVFSNEDQGRVAPGLERLLRRLYRPEIERVEALLGRDLSAWK